MQLQNININTDIVFRNKKANAETVEAEYNE